MKRITIEVIQEDIDSGIKGSCRQCPIALALMRQFPSNLFEVGRDGFDVYKEDVYKCTIHFENAKAPKFTSAFDKGESVSPFSFSFPFVPFLKEVPPRVP